MDGATRQNVVRCLPCADLMLYGQVSSGLMQMDGIR